MKKLLVPIVALALITAGCKSRGSDNQQDGKTITLDLTPKSGSKVSGTAEFAEKGGEVTLTMNMTGLEPGIHATHIHEKSDCSAPDASSAGGHWNPTFKNHGKWGSANYHRGDIGNFPVNADGVGTVVFSTSEWCIGCGDKSKDIVGKSIIVHTGSDDYVTQPTGDAGGRIACTAIIK
ncbi:MAG TPA: superoxide dismutase family protein [Flavobacterium sp.]|jgi:Cu-Zn family superoxide dismutase|nr:superoxide dismutase family protein [Flavobacterium sp.]